MENGWKVSVNIAIIKRVSAHRTMRTVLPQTTFPVIDLFAGPGGLGEGFSSLWSTDGGRYFKIKLSIEKDNNAHRTLELRAFFREFPRGKAPEAYYDYLMGCISRADLFERYPLAARCARQQAWRAELGGDDTPEQIVDERIREALGNRKRWVLIGGPPCQAYSLAGRSRVIGGEGLEKYESDPKHRLYRHYLRILAVHQPPVFVMENVKGLLSAKIKNKQIIERIFADLRYPLKALPAMRAIALSDSLEYRLMPLVASESDLFGRFSPEDFVVRSEDYGVPQARHRIIILGIRSDHLTQPRKLKRLPQANIEQVIGDLPRLRSGLSREEDSPQAWRDAVQEVTEAPWMRNGMSVELRDALLCAVKQIGTDMNRGRQFMEVVAVPARDADWFNDTRLRGICNHEARGHIRADLHRYLFSAVYAHKFGRSPLLEDLPKALLPEHRNVADALEGTKFNDRFRVQIEGRPSTTVVSHMAKDGHYYIHYDPTQCRSLTVREAARLQTFPDNYYFEGPRTEQYKQVGNAVPPSLARQIAKVVHELLTGG